MKPWPYPRLFAHRGGGSAAPENTLAAIRLGQSLGYRACEFDVKLARDGVAMLLHDATLERTTSGKGPAGERDWAQLATLDAGGWHSPGFKGEPIARFDTVAKLLAAEGAMANVEIKPSPGTDAHTGAIVAALAGEFWKKASVPPLMSSFSFAALESAHLMAPELPRGWLTPQFEREDLARLASLQAVSLHTDHAKLDRATVELLHREGYRVLAYTVNDAARARELFSWGVDGLFTDNLAEFARQFPEAL